MSINVTVNGNPLNIRHGRMVLSDLDQIKKNERDRRRRLRLEQVRQQSKEISDRLLERAKNVVKQELKKLEHSDKLNFKQTYNGKIMEIQQKYQEDMADIGQAHISATLEPDYNALVQEKERNNKLTAMNRGKEAMKQMNNLQQKETVQQLHQERLRQVRDLEDLRSAMIAKLPQNSIPEKDAMIKETDEENKQQKSTKKKTRKHLFKKSPGKITKSYIKVVANDFKTCSPLLISKSKTLKANPKRGSSVLKEQFVVSSVAKPPTLKTAASVETAEQIVQICESEYNNKNSGKSAPISNTTSTDDKTLRYNPEDYVQSTSDTTARSDNSGSFSDDSSYFVDSGVQSKCIRSSKHVSCPANDKVQLYDHSKHQSNTYNKPIGVVEKIHAWNEPSATDLAQEIEQAETVEKRLAENRESGIQKRGEDAVLREKVRRDYQALVQNLNRLVCEERKLKASQVERYPKDVYTQEERRKILRDQHKKKLNRALKTLLDEKCLKQCPSYPMERQITLTPRGNDKSVDMGAVWEEQCYSNERTETGRTAQNKCKESEISREEQILDMLKKVEKQKQLLLQEFGADLPNDIFNASMKPLFEQEKSIPIQSCVAQDTHIQKSLSPEIKVISTCSHNESSKQDKPEEKVNSSIRKVEIAVQTTAGDRYDVAQDKSIQVELMKEKEKEKESEPNSINPETDTATKHHPIEPKITIITPSADSSESTSSMVTNSINDIDKQGPTVTPKKEKCAKTSKRVPPKIFHKSSSICVNKTPPSAKKFSKTLPRSRCSSLKKTSCDAADTPSKKIKIYVNRNGFNIRVNPPQVAEVAVDVSTQSSQIYSTTTQEQTTRKLYCVQSQSKRIQTKDISDTSTSFASPPPIKPRDILEALNNNISILEMLDSSANESLRLVKRDISPVSTPETPSPRTMRMPSNKPHPNKINRMLRFATTDSQVIDSSELSSTKSDHSISTELSDYQRINGHLSSEKVATYSKEPVVSLEFCSCENSDCKLIHAKFDNVRNYALKNCPQILQKYEDLQTLCAERIVSLTHLIEKVRNEQKGVELSVISAGDETSLMQLPPPKLMANDLQSVRNLVENIEAIHNQLVKTLIESQRIIQNKTVDKENTDQSKDINLVTQANENIPKNITDFIEPKAKTQETKAKPKIISEERVNIRLDGFKVQYRPQTIMTISPESNSPLTTKCHDEEVIEKLSKEILEQSKSFKNNLMATKEIDNSIVNQTIQTSTDTTDSKNDLSSRTQKNDATTQKHFSKELKENKDFIPLLADIPKVSRTIENALVTNGRSKPPVSLLSGLYRAEIESSGHELSTIIEFDTPDTVNKSQNNIKSPLSIKKVAETQITKAGALVTPSEHVASSLNIHDEHFKKLYDSSTSKLSSMVSLNRIEETATLCDSSKISKSTGCRRFVQNKDEHENESSRVKTRETNNKKLQCDATNQELLQIEELQPLSSVNINSNEQEKNNKDKITSTSSNSFSGLSGVSQIASTPSSDVLRYASSPEEMEIALKKHGLGWAITTLKKTREASALSSSSNSDERTPINTAKRIISPVRKQFDSNYGLPDFSDVSSISIKEASKSTEQAVLLKGRTSTPKMQNSNSNSARTNSSSTNISENCQEPSDGLIVPDICLTNTKSNIRRLENL